MLSMNLFNLGVLPILALLPTLAKCGQVPVVDGVIGGVPHLSVSQKAANLLAEPLRVTNTTTPGKLRFVENSGICGIYMGKATLPFSPLIIQPINTCFSQRPRPMFFRLRATAI